MGGGRSGVPLFIRLFLDSIGFFLYSFRFSSTITRPPPPPPPPFAFLPFAWPLHP